MLFWNVEIQMHVNFAFIVFSHCSIGIYQAFDGQTEFSQVFSFEILSYPRKFHACENNVF